MLSALILAVAQSPVAHYLERDPIQPPSPGYGYGPRLPNSPETRPRATPQLPLHLSLEPRSQDQRSSRIQWLEQACSRVQGVLPWPEEAEDFGDLAAFGAAIEGCRIVTLGEPSHGDGAAFSIKARLVRYLYQECGFDLIVFESGLFDCDAAWRRAEAGQALEDVGLAALQPVWSRSQTVHDLFAWMQTTQDSARPLRLAGMDLMPTSDYSSEAGGELLELGQALGIDADLLDEGLVILTDFPHSYRDAIRAHADEREVLLGSLRDLGRAFAKGSQRIGLDVELARRAIFYAQFIQSIAVAVEMSALTDFSKPEGDSHLNMRDEQMAANLEWLAKVQNPASKIIVWGATSHLSRARQGLEVRTARSMVPVGEHLERSMPGEVYHLGVSSYAGRVGSGSGQPQVLEAAVRGSLEELLNASELPAAFLDLTRLDCGGAWLGQGASLRAMGHFDVRGNWARSLDGVYFVRESLPVLPLEK